MRRLLLVLAIVCLAAGTARASIVDTLGGFDSSRPGWSGSVNAAVSASGGNTEVLSVSSAGRAQWQRGADRIRMLAGYTRQTEASREIAEDLLAHLRHNHRLGGPLHSLAFAQAQRNPFQRLRSRTLLGLGFRVDLQREDTWSASVGLAHMFESERIEDESGTRNTQRLSSFLQAEARVSQTAKLEATAYLQPSWSDFGDMRATGNAGLKVALREGWSLVVGGSVSHDPRPPEGVKKTDWSTSTGIAVEF